jgi:hypothetical protein
MRQRDHCQLLDIKPALMLERALPAWATRAAVLCKTSCRLELQAGSVLLSITGHELTVLVKTTLLAWATYRQCWLTEHYWPVLVKATLSAWATNRQCWPNLTLPVAPRTYRDLFFITNGFELPAVM